MNIFIDDERFPPDDGKDWEIMRTMQEVIDLIKIRDSMGVKISFISFDHDLGDGVPTGMDIVKWLCDYDMDNQIFANDFSFYVHSQNPVGKANIEGYLNQYLFIR